MITAGVLELLFIAEAATTAEDRAWAVVVVVGMVVTVVIVVIVGGEVKTAGVVTEEVVQLLVTDTGGMMEPGVLFNGKLFKLVLLLLPLDGTNGGGIAVVTMAPEAGVVVRNGAIVAKAGDEVDVVAAEEVIPPQAMRTLPP